MQSSTPAHAIELLDKAFNAGDIDTILRYYDEHAIVLAEPGVEARGPQAIRRLYTRAAGSGVTVRQLQTHVLEADGIALFTSHYAISAPGEPEKPLPPRPSSAGSRTAAGRRC